jgi:flagellar basal-body rod modification protein FlgD
MSTVAATSSANTAAASTAVGALGKGLGKDDFLKLLVAQLQNQDPLDPSDPTEFTAQLAQYSSLEQQFTTNEHLAKIAAPDANTERVSALGMIGHGVVVEKSGFTLGSDPVGLGFKLDAAASNVNLMVKNAAGDYVGLVPVGAQEAGSRFFTWEGKGLNGETLPPGNYTLEVSAMNGDKAVAATARLKGWVTGVDLNAQGSVLVTSVGDVPMLDVKRVDL